MSKKLQEQLRTALGQEPQISEAHLQQTLAQSRLAYARTNTARPIGFGNFMLQQLRLYGYKAWLWQGAGLVLQCVWLGLYFASNAFSGYSSQLGFALCLFGCTALLAGVPMLERSWNYRMSEIEMTCYFSLPRLLLARILVIGLGSLPCVGALCLVLKRFCAQAGVSFASGAGFLWLSYLLTAAGCVVIIDRLHGKGATAGCYIWAIVVTAALLLLWGKYPLMNASWLLPLMCAAALAALICFTALMLKNAKTLDAQPA